MFVFDDSALARHAARMYLAGQPTGSIGEMVAASKVVDLAAARARLRPPDPGSLAHKLQSISDAFDMSDTPDR